MPNINEISPWLIAFCVCIILFEIFYIYHFKTNQEEVDLDHTNLSPNGLKKFIEHKIKKDKDKMTVESIISSVASGAFRGGMMGLITGGVEGGITGAIILGIINPVVLAFEYHAL